MADFAAGLSRLESVLSTDEVARCARFRRAPDRHRYIVARGLLRIIAGRYLGLRAEEVAFDYSESGKPRLRAAQNPIGLEFNLSHSGDALLIGFSEGFAIGVDVERLDPDVELDPIARQVLSDDEMMQLEGLPRAERLAAFYRYWTCKEACLKGTGAGVGAGMRQLEVQFGRGDSVALTDPANADLRGWTLLSIDMPPDYFAAMAAACTAPLIDRRRLTDLYPL